MNFKLKQTKLFFLALFCLFSLPQLAAAVFTYTPMEEIPGFGRPTSDIDYILAIYQFGLWTVGIAAVLMISIGAFMYITSAGNTSQMGKAKEIIFDALIGVILALTSYVLLNTINPALVKITTTTPSSGTGSSTTPGGTGKCEPITTGSGPCTVANLEKTCFGKEHAEQASAICFAESGGKAIPSGVDKCQPGGESISWGLFQINISSNNLIGSSCSQNNCAASAATPAYTASNHNCTKQANYDSCVASAKIDACNIETACKLSSNGTRWGQWGANKNCGFPK